MLKPPTKAPNPFRRMTRPMPTEEMATKQGSDVERERRCASEPAEIGRTYWHRTRTGKAEEVPCLDGGEERERRRASDERADGPRTRELVTRDVLSAHPVVEAQIRDEDDLPGDETGDSREVVEPADEEEGVSGRGDN